MSDADHEIRSRRVLAAPREVVFRAFADPELLARWWGPSGSLNIFQDFDFRTDGTWRFVMRAADGAEYPMAKEFLEVVPPERIVMRHEDAVHGHLMTMTYAEQGPASTALAWCMRFDTAEEAARVREFVVAANEENFDRLAALLETTHDRS